MFAAEFPPTRVVAEFEICMPYSARDMPTFCGMSVVPCTVGLCCGRSGLGAPTPAQSVDAEV
ncbi:hypothetical protein CEQ30_25350 [Nocardia brasiliensis]|nr:hypothetical protein CEQ30_25350 [Nocardia brasiliensis]